MPEEKTVMELVEWLQDIDNRIYMNKMRLKSIESNFERVAPYSAEFDCLMNKALQIREELEGRNGLYSEKFLVEYKLKKKTVIENSMVSSRKGRGNL